GYNDRNCHSGEYCISVPAGRPISAFERLSHRSGFEGPGPHAPAVRPNSVNPDFGRGFRGGAAGDLVLPGMVLWRDLRDLLQWPDTWKAAHGNPHPDARWPTD